MDAPSWQDILPLSSSAFWIEKFPYRFIFQPIDLQNRRRLLPYHAPNDKKKAQIQVNSWIFSSLYAQYYNLTEISKNNKKMPNSTGKC